MSSKKLSSVTCHVIQTYGKAASNVIHAYRAGGERVVGMLDERWNSAFKQSRSQLDSGVAKNATAVHQLLQKFTLKGLTVTSGGAQGVVNQVVKLADAGVMSVAENVDRFEGKTGVNVLSSVAHAALLGAVPLSNLADQIEQKSADLASKIAGDKLVKSTAKRRPKVRTVAKAVATSTNEADAKVDMATEAVAA